MCMSVKRVRCYAVDTVTVFTALAVVTTDTPASSRFFSILSDCNANN